jgi:hypothetical protein
VHEGFSLRSGDRRLQLNCCPNFCLGYADAGNTEKRIKEAAIPSQSPLAATQ